MNKGFRKRDRQIFSLRRLSRILICALALEQREVASSRCSWITCSRPGSIFSFFLCNMIDKGSLFEKEKREMWTHRAEPHNPTRICDVISFNEWSCETKRSVLQLTLERALEFFLLELLVTITRYDLHLSQASRPARVVEMRRRLRVKRQKGKRSLFRRLDLIYPIPVWKCSR